MAAAADQSAPAIATPRLRGVSPVTKALLLGSAIVMLAHSVPVLGRSVVPAENTAVRDVLALFDVGQERALAAWWTAALLVAACAGALLVAGLAERAGAAKREARSWRVVAVVFALLSFDEIASVHERGAAWTKAVVDADSSLVRLGWMIPASVVLVLSLVVLAPAFRALPRRPRTIIVTGLGISIAGALGLELVNVLLADAGAAPRLRSLVLAAEEAAEMGGIVVVLAGISAAVALASGGGFVTARYLRTDDPGDA